MGSHAFYPSTRDVETGLIWLGRERNIRQEETGSRHSVMKSEVQSEEGRKYKLPLKPKIPVSQWKHCPSFYLL